MSDLEKENQELKETVKQLQKQVEYYQSKEIRDGWREWAETATQRHREIQESFLRKAAGL